MKYSSDNGFSNAGVSGILCLFLFAAFIFCYVYFMQCDVLSLTQHVLSGGRTHYVRLTGAVIITIVSLLLQSVVARSLSTLPSGLYSLSFVPSALLIYIITGLVPQFSVAGLICASVIFIIWLVVCVKFLHDKRRHATGSSLYALLISNLIILAAITVSIPLSGAGNRNTVFELRAQRYLNEGKPEKVLTMGAMYTAPSPLLTQLRAWALAKCDSLSDRLFEYSIPDGMPSLLPDLRDSTKMIYNPVKIYRNFGTLPYPGQTPENYLNIVSNQPELIKTHSVIRQYQLSTFLLDGKLNEFASLYKEIFSDSSLHAGLIGKHFREALVLYQHLTSSPVVTVKDDVLSQNYDDFMTVSGRGSRNAVYRNQARQQYGDTYWYYWYYHKKSHD